MAGRMAALFLMAVLAGAAHGKRVQVELAQAQQGDAMKGHAQAGMANLKKAMEDPASRRDLAQALRDPAVMAQVTELMSDPSFQEEAKQQAAQWTGAAGARAWEKQHAARHRAGEMSLAELGAANLKGALRDPSVLLELKGMDSEEDTIRLNEMTADPSFQREAKGMAATVKRALAERSQAQSLAEVSQAGRSRVRPTTALAALLTANPTAAFQAGGLPRAGLARTGAGKMMARAPQFDITQAAGVSDPLGFWDPAGLSESSPRPYKWLRNAELKHGRLAMLASLGWLVGEQYHPLFGGNIDGPAISAWQDPALSTFWPILLGVAGLLEGYGLTNGVLEEGEIGTLADGVEFDPLGLKPEDAEEFDIKQTKELNNGRLAMIGLAGMVAQELVSGEKLF